MLDGMMGGGGVSKAKDYSSAFTRTNEAAPTLGLRSAEMYKPVPIMPTKDGGGLMIVPVPMAPPTLPPDGNGAVPEEQYAQMMAQMESAMEGMPGPDLFEAARRGASGGDGMDDETAAAIEELLLGGMDWAKDFRFPAE